MYSSGKIVGVLCAVAPSARKAADTATISPRAGAPATAASRRGRACNLSDEGSAMRGVLSTAISASIDSAVASLEVRERSVAATKNVGGGGLSARRLR